MRKGIFYAVIVVCLCIGGLSVNEYLLSDRVPPRIAFQKEIFYTPEMTERDLLDGVTAYDSEDGDVTDSLIIERVIPNREDDTAVIVYAARDYSNNVVRERRIIDFAKEQD